MLQEHHLIYLVLAGALLVLIAWGWCVRRAFGKGVFSGLLSLVPPFFLLWSLSRSPRPGDSGQRGGRGPLALMVLGLVLILATVTWNRYNAVYRSFGEREKMVDGQLHITLTGWNKDDYSLLARRPAAVVVQMGNADVTNETLKYLEGMSLLEELNLNDSQVDDDGLAQIAAFPNLRVLKLARTKITDAGFQAHLASKESLQEVDVRKTAVRGKSLRDWKNARKDDRKFLGP